MTLFRIPAAGAIALLALLAQPVLLPRAVAEKPVAQSGHQRLLPLEGGRNFRDLGGYRTTDGHSVKWGVLFRSGEMHDLTAGDYAYLNRIGIRTVCDFRDVHERKAEPTEWKGAHPPVMLADDYDARAAGLMPNADMKDWTVDHAREVMTATYPRMLVTFAPQYRRMFRELVAGRAPLAFHCSAGKDRTGIAAALILTALGVPRETVVQDYLLTNQYLHADAIKGANSPAAQPWMALPRPVLEAYMQADRHYIEAALASLDAHAGGARGYLRDEMGLSDADVARLRKLYLN